jgi:diguanylate cyclase (GGDEF)-like protein
VAASKTEVDAVRSIRGRNPVRDLIPAPRAWAIWDLPRWVACFVVLVVLTDAAVFGVEAVKVSIAVHDLALFAGLLVCSAATVELTRRVGENLGFVKDVYAVWELPVAMLLPLPYVPVLPVIRFALTQWRILRVPVYRRVFSAAAIGLSYVSAALAFRFLIHLVPGAAASPAGHALAWMAFVAVGAAVQWVVNQTLVLTAIKGSNPDVSLRDEQFAKEPIYNDISELCVAVLVTFCVAYSWIALVFAFPFITLLQRSVRHARLLQDARADSKTGLLNAATWENGAKAELARAVRTRTQLAVALLDIDRFKVINDTFGHLTGDEVLKEIAHTLRTMLREYDLAGRFGGEEFALLLPQTRAVDAFRIAERIRSAISGLCIIAPGATGGERVHVTVSIGVAALDSGSKREYAELMAAADAALYRAKSGGRDQVQMISTTRGLHAVSSLPRAVGGEDRRPSLFRRALLSRSPPGALKAAPSLVARSSLLAPGVGPGERRSPVAASALCLAARCDTLHIHAL